MDLRITIPNSRQIAKTFRKAPALSQREFGKALARTAAHITSEAIKNAPVGKHSGGGNLRQLISTRQLSPLSHLVISGAKYSAYVDQGTRPHTILPRNKPFLAFKVDGRWVRAKRVNHPGTKAQPFFSDAVKSGEDYAAKEMGKAMDRVLKNL